jgi:hypothetical protein
LIGSTKLLLIAFLGCLAQTNIAANIALVLWFRYGHFCGYGKYFWFATGYMPSIWSMGCMILVAFMAKRHGYVSMDSENAWINHRVVLWAEF